MKVFGGFGSLLKAAKAISAVPRSRDSLLFLHGNRKQQRPRRLRRPLSCRDGQESSSLHRTPAPTADSLDFIWMSTSIYLHRLSLGRSQSLHRSTFYHGRNPLSLFAPLSKQSPRLWSAAMFQRANARYKSTAPPESTFKQAAATQSSSQSSLQNGSITDSFQKGQTTGRPSSPSAMTSKTATSQRQTITGFASRGIATNSLASLCHGADSFAANPLPVAPPQSRTVPTVLFNDDDFSDDDHLDLEYQCPASLPAMPAAEVVKTALPNHPTSQSSQIPWSSSPQSHMFPPRPVESKGPKRDSSGFTQPATAPPKAKKRTLPSSFKRTEGPSIAERAPSEADANIIRKPMATPAKPGKNVPWDLTYSATKEQRRQLKTQSSKTKSGLDGMKDDGLDSGKASRQQARHSAISLSSEQQQVLNLVVEKGQSVFFTGPAGTGKSVLLRAIIAELKKKWARDPERLSVTASTGLAACNIGGQTLHSFAGIGLGKEDVPALVKKIRRTPRAKNRWLRTKTLIIDEVSMVDGELFDKLGQIARTIRNDGRPWGGIQVVITGDFFQLPPVPDGDKKKDGVKFAFEAATWNTSIDHTIGLTQVFRQRDPEFAGMLNEMRLGRISDNTVKIFKDLARPLEFNDNVGVTELFPTKFEVERSNEVRLRALTGEVYNYESSDTGEPTMRDKLLQHMMAPKVLSLKKGAQVMLIKNLDDTLVNGSLGKVVAFMNEATFNIWSDRQASGEADGDDMGEAGAKKIRGFTLDSKDVKDLKEYPVIKFNATDGTHRTLLCSPEEWKVELPNGEVQAARKQLPLILAWALSIHKAQGQTLERVKVDLGKAFEKGQAYVALSRAVSKGGLQVLRFEKSKVMAHPRVIAFYNRLYSVDLAITATKKPNTMKQFTKPNTTSSFSMAGKGIEVIDLDEEEAMAAAYA